MWRGIGTAGNHWLSEQKLPPWTQGRLTLEKALPGEAHSCSNRNGRGRRGRENKWRRRTGRRGEWKVVDVNLDPLLLFANVTCMD